jgi:hypothetical protein
MQADTFRFQNATGFACGTLCAISAVDMKKYLTFFILLILTSCGGPSFEKEYYEQSTKIKFPMDYTVVATADNGEFLTITILDLNKDGCDKFIRDNKFQTLYNDSNSVLRSFEPQLSGLNFLDSCYRKLPDKNLLVREKSFENGTGWTYYIDTLTCRLYCQINYPDWGGK